MTFSPLIDRFGRVHNNLRLSVTDRCNIRCFYCMPEDVVFQPRAQLLSYEEIRRFVKVAAQMGVSRLRITGGEPLVRSDLSELIRQLATVDGVNDIALTTNGVLLADQAAELRRAGLQRLNISLDTLNEDTFFRISRRQGLDRVLNGIATAMDAGFEQIRLNAIAIRDLTEAEILPLAEFARKQRLELRFIEFMPLDADENWESQQVLSGEEIRTRIESKLGSLQPAERTDPSQPAVDFKYADGGGRVGFINPVTEPFCESCSRLRLTSEGQIRNCLFATDEWDARELLRGGAEDEELAALIRDCVSNKRAAHGIDDEGFQRPARAMYQIGG